MLSSELRELSLRMYRVVLDERRGLDQREVITFANAVYGMVDRVAALEAHIVPPSARVTEVLAGVADLNAHRVRRLQKIVGPGGGDAA